MVFESSFLPSPPGDFEAVFTDGSTGVCFPEGELCLKREALSCEPLESIPGASLEKLSEKCPFCNRCNLSLDACR